MYSRLGALYDTLDGQALTRWKGQDCRKPGDFGLFDVLQNAALRRDPLDDLDVPQ